MALFRRSETQGWHPHTDYCDVCNKELVGRGTKYKNPHGLGYLCREHAIQEGLRVFKPIIIVPIKSIVEK